MQSLGGYIALAMVHSPPQDAAVLDNQPSMIEAGPDRAVRETLGHHLTVIDYDVTYEQESTTESWPAT
jgi:hypothetical protein